MKLSTKKLNQICKRDGLKGWWWPKYKYRADYGILYALVFDESVSDVTLQDLKNGKGFGADKYFILAVDDWKGEVLRKGFSRLAPAKHEFDCMARASGHYHHIRQKARDNLWLKNRTYEEIVYEQK